MVERKGWAERVERVEKISAAARQEARSAAGEVAQLQV